MAHCYNCGERVGVFRFWLGAFRHLGRNFWRSKQLPISNCPHCGSEIQETPLTSFGFLGIFIAVLLIAMQVIERMQLAASHEDRAYIGLIVFLILGQWTWWRYVSKLKKPSKWG